MPSLCTTCSLACASHAHFVFSCATEGTRASPRHCDGELPVRTPFSGFETRFNEPSLFSNPRPPRLVSHAPRARYSPPLSRSIHRIAAHAVRPHPPPTGRHCAAHCAALTAASAASSTSAALSRVAHRATALAHHHEQPLRSSSSSSSTSGSGPTLPHSSLARRGTPPRDGGQRAPRAQRATQRIACLRR